MCCSKKCESVERKNSVRKWVFVGYDNFYELLANSYQNINKSEYLVTILTL